MQRGSGNMEPISKACVKEFCKSNGVKITEMAEIAGYLQPSFSRALKEGWIKSEAVFDMCRFFDLPRNYFEGRRSVQSIVAKTEEEPQIEEPVEFPTAEVLDTKKADALNELYGLLNYTDLFYRLVREDYDRHKNEILAKRYEGLSKEELIEQLVKLSA